MPPLPHMHAFVSLSYHSSPTADNFGENENESEIFVSHPMSSSSFSVKGLPRRPSTCMVFLQIPQIKGSDSRIKECTKTALHGNDPA